VPVAGESDTGSYARYRRATRSVFRLRTTEEGRVDADFELTLGTPKGAEHWDFGWNLQDVLLEPAHGRSLREQFDSFMRSLFDDHMSDLAERGLAPNRTFDELPIRMEVPDGILRRLK
jgi:hypothetical protein